MVDLGFSLWWQIDLLNATTREREREREETMLLGFCFSPKVYAPKVNGGLGIRKLTTFNKVLLGKWLWRFGVEETRLWWRVVALNFGEEWGVGRPN